MQGNTTYRGLGVRADQIVVVGDASNSGRVPTSEAHSFYAGHGWCCPNFALMAFSSAGRREAKIGRYINGRCLLPEKFKGYRLRVTEGELKGLWLTRIDVTTKGGIAFRGSPNWQEVSLRPDQFQINPRFQEDESAAWLGLSQQNALTFQTIVLSAGIQTEIVDP